jgi:hypothetical protein
MILLSFFIVGCMCESPEEGFGPGVDYPPSDVETERTSMSIPRSSINNPGSSLVPADNSLPIPKGCPPVKIITEETPPPSSSVREISKRYNVNIIGTPAPGYEDALNFAFDKIKASRPDLFNKISRVYIYPTHEEFLRATGGSHSLVGLTKPSSGEIYLSPHVRNTNHGAWVIAHEVGHISHGPMRPGRRAEDIANSFADRVMGMSERQSIRGVV